MTDAAGMRLGPAVAGGPMVSVVMPTYRRAQHIGDSIRSLLRGTWTDFELLVCDDGGGADGTREAVEKAAAGDPRVKYHRNARRLGMPGNLNAGILRTVGCYVAVCHDHDLYAPDFLSEMLDALVVHPTALYVHCGIATVDQDGAVTGEHIGEWPTITRGREWLRYMLRSLHCPVCALTVVRREAHQRYGLYDPAYGFVADTELWLRLSAHGDVAYLARPLIQVREREANHWANGQGTLHMRNIAAAQRKYAGQFGGSVTSVVCRLHIESNLAWAIMRSAASSAYRGFRAWEPV